MNWTGHTTLGVIANGLVYEVLTYTQTSLYLNVSAKEKFEFSIQLVYYEMIATLRRQLHDNTEL